MGCSTGRMRLRMGNYLGRADARSQSSMGKIVLPSVLRTWRPSRVARCHASQLFNWPLQIVWSERGDACQVSVLIGLDHSADLKAQGS